MVELSHIAVTHGTKKNPTPALKDVAVTFREDEIVSVMGKSGSGTLWFRLLLAALLGLFSLILCLVARRQLKDLYRDTQGASRSFLRDTSGKNARPILDSGNFLMCNV